MEISNLLDKEFKGTAIRMPIELRGKEFQQKLRQYKRESVRTKEYNN